MKEVQQKIKDATIRKAITPTHVLQVLTVVLAQLLPTTTTTTTSSRQKSAYEEYDNDIVISQANASEAKRINNHLFKTAIQCKLILPFLECPQAQANRCKCGSELDT
jgi:flagellar biosynthesis component FlhA